MQKHHNAHKSVKHELNDFNEHIIFSCAHWNTKVLIIFCHILRIWIKISATFSTNIIFIAGPIDTVSVSLSFSLVCQIKMQHFHFIFYVFNQNAFKQNLSLLLCQSKQYPVTISLQSIFKYKIEMKINMALLRQQECTMKLYSEAAKIDEYDAISKILQHVCMYFYVWMVSEWVSEWRQKFSTFQ